jgi:hypothetical protein
LGFADVSRRKLEIYMAKNASARLGRIRAKEIRLWFEE